MISKKLNPKGKIKNKYLQDNSLIHLILYFFTYLPTYISK